jgi:thiol-disulfide isomerase/thioredoxin
MKNITFLFIIMLICSAGCKTTKQITRQKPEARQTQAPASNITPSAVNFSDQTTWILGYFTPDRLTHEPYSTWYLNGFDDYQVNSESVNKLMDVKKDGLSIKVVMGTWCPDSRREVPRFMRVLDIWKFPVGSVTFIGVDDAKKSPVGEYEGLNILRVPTFIIYKNNIEAGRIIENPATSLEQDMVNILSRNEK